MASSSSFFSVVSLTVGVNAVQHLLLGNINSRFWLIIPFIFVILGTSVDNWPFFFYTFTLVSWWIGPLVVQRSSDERTKWITDMPFLIGLFVWETTAFALSIAHFWDVTNTWAGFNLGFISLALLVDMVGTGSLIHTIRRKGMKEFLGKMYEHKIAQVATRYRTNWHQLETATVLFAMPLQFADDGIGGEDDGGLTREIGEIQRNKAHPLQSSDLL